jgi:psiF repeat-containing protein
MFRIASVAAIVLSASIAAASAQTTDAKKISPSRLKEMKAGWSKNKPKMMACKKQVKAKGLEGDDRWFYMEDCMNKS